MPDLVRAKDWAATPLGSIGGWSDTLVAMVNQVLASPLPNVLCWGANHLTFYNEAAIPTFGAKHPNVLGIPYRDVFPEVWSTIGPEMDRALGGAAIERENVIVNILMSGGLESHTFNYARVPIYEQGAVAGVLTPYRDVTELSRTRSERDLLAMQMGQYLSVTSDCIVAVSREWCITYMNGAAEGTYGSSRDLVGNNFWRMFPQAIYEDSPFVQHLTRAMEQGVPGSFEAHYPLPLDMWLRVDVYATDKGIVIYSRNITERKRTEAVLMQTEKLAAVGRMASSIAHEINNPLESVTNLLYIARGSDDQSEVRRMLDTADQELRRVAVITNQTLRFHKQSSRPQDVTCVDLFSSVLNMFEGKIRNSGLHVEKRKRAQQPVRIFEGDIRQVLNNLVGNAIDAMPRGGRLLVRSREGTDWRSGRRGLVLTIADTGSGIAPATRARIFEAFFTTKGIGGTGLGLWISRDIVERHRGVLLVRSSQRPGHTGTVFTLFLPFDSVPVPAAVALQNVAADYAPVAVGV